MSVFRDGFFRNVDLGSETATSSLLRPEAAKTGQQAAKTGQQAAKSGQQAAKTSQPAAKTGQSAAKTGQSAAKTGPTVAKPTHQSNTIRSEGSLSIDSLSGSSSVGGKPIFSETNMQSSLGYLP
jgi:hypothetical protein